MNSPRFSFAINTCGKDKTWDFKLLTTRYKDKEGTLEDVKRHVAAGHALCAGLLGGKSRSKANVIGSHWILLDIDNSAPLLDESGNPVKDETGKAKTVYTGELTLEAALAHPFIQKYCALIYTTASHRPDWHKFRLVFLLPEYVEGADTVEACTRFLMQHLPHDPACKDASRVFYGNSKAEFPLVQPGIALPMEWVEEARAIAKQERVVHAERVKQFEERKAEIRARNDAEGWDTDALIQEALSFIPPRSPGSNNYDECRQVLMALFSQYGHGAEAIAERWSPSIKGTTWNVGQKIRSFKRGGISVGTLFHIAKQYGFKFPAPKHHTWEPKEDYTKRDAEQEQFDDYCDRHAEGLQEESLKSFFNNRLERLRKFLTRMPFKGFGEALEIKTETKPDTQPEEHKEVTRLRVQEPIEEKEKEQKWCADFPGTKAIIAPETWILYNDKPAYVEKIIPYAGHIFDIFLLIPSYDRVRVEKEFSKEFSSLYDCFVPEKVERLTLNTSQFEPRTIKLFDGQTKCWVKADSESYTWKGISETFWGTREGLWGFLYSKVGGHNLKFGYIENVGEIREVNGRAERGTATFVTISGERIEAKRLPGTMGGEFESSTFASFYFDAWYVDPDPRRDGWKVEVYPSNKIEFNEGDRQKTIESLAQKAQESGTKLIVLDSSEGGTGKSHVVGDLTPESLGVKTVIYTNKNRTPTTAGIEANYPPMPVRNPGLFEDETQKTPLGKNAIRWPRRGETPNLEGNCSKAYLFHIFAAKGYFSETSASAEGNPICRTCKWKSNCAGVDNLPTIPNHTFRGDRRNALASDRIRCSLDSLPDIGGDSENEDARRVAIIVDEATQIKFHDQTEVDLHDFDNTWMFLQSQVHKSWSLITELSIKKDQLANDITLIDKKQTELESKIAGINIQSGLSLAGINTEDPNKKLILELEQEIFKLSEKLDKLLDEQSDIIDRIDEVERTFAGLPEALKTLEPIIFALRQILNGEENITSESRFGWTEAMIRANLGNLLDDQVRDALEVIRRLSPNLADLLRQADTVTLDGMSRKDRKGSADSLKFARKAMQQEADEENREAIANMPANCIVPILDILLDQQDGSFRIAYQNLTIYTKNDRHREQLKKASLTVILDGTETRETLAKKLECDPNEIIVIRQKPKSYKNLKIIQITGLGLLGSDRSNSGKQRIVAMTTAIKEEHGAENVGVIDHKKALDPEEESEAGHWHHHNRGSNRFKEKTALITIGTPTPNIGHLQMLFATMTGDRNPARGNPAFDEFVEERVRNEMHQAGWRLRSTRRPDEQLYWYVVGDADLSYLKDRFPDAKFEIKPAIEVSPDAGNRTERTYLSLVNAAKVLKDKGVKITQEALANIVGCDRSYISQISKKFFGKRRFPSFVKMLLYLFSTLYRGSHVSGDSLTEEELFIAESFLPQCVEAMSQTSTEDVSEPVEIIKDVLDTASSLGWASFKRVLSTLAPDTRGQLLGYMLSMMPEDWRSPVLEISEVVIQT